MTIDFTQIESGEDFELLCEDLLQAMGFTIEAKVAPRPPSGQGHHRFKGCERRGGLHRNTPLFGGRWKLILLGG